MNLPNFKENLNWSSWSTPFSGYGIVGMEYAAALNRLTQDKVSVQWQRVGNRDSLEYKTLLPEWKYLMDQKPFEKARIGVIKSTPEYFGQITNDIRIGYTMVENTQVGKKWIETCNSMNAIFVPSQFLVDVFRGSGLTKPIHVVRQGINPKLYPYVKRERKEKFIFGMCGWMDQRKNWIETVQAFTSEFEWHEPVELWIKNTNNTFGFEEAVDSRVKIVDRLDGFSGLLNYYTQLDCLVYPSRAEGSGMPPKEAMATGLPVIITNHSGLAEISKPEYSYFLTPVAVDLEDYRGENQPGYQARIDVQELMYYMRYVYENWDKAMEKGYEASKWMHREWTYNQCAQEVLDILIKEYHYS